ncbi:hypothetical protein SHKM778_01460 [Streptomyces sp. KM77-8]|uniref:Glycosyl hydrolase family 13 catalytic domain-containing protein n=1 Tax=Streptomyces haneummycinicus TaxID=3074435 RepID=A0AAT9H8R0_9ACTN
MHEIYRDWRKILDAYSPPRTAVAEAWVPGARRALYARPDELGQAFNFEYLQAGWDARELRQVITESLETAHTAGASATWVLSNHDVVRHASRLVLPPGTDDNAWLLSGGHAPSVDRDAGLRRARAATLLMLALPGSAYLYQGRNWACPRSPTCPPRFSRTRSGNRRGASARAATAAGCRCRGRRPARRTASGRPAPGCRSRRPSRRTPSRRRTGWRARPWSCTAPPCAPAAN